MYIKATKLTHPAVMLLILMVAIAAVGFTKMKQKMSNSLFGKAADTANSVTKLKNNIPDEHQLKDLLDEKTEDIKKELIINREYYIVPPTRRIYRYDPYVYRYDPYRYYYISPNSPYYSIPPNTPHYYYNPPIQMPKPNPQPCPPHQHEHKKFF